jgi:hypothetical protein
MGWFLLYCVAVCGILWFNYRCSKNNEKWDASNGEK